MPYSHIAQQVQSRGRGDDTMLIHMTPHEVGGLQALAVAHGGSLTINPDTGLPEAGFLSSLLPMILGGIGMAFGIPPVWMGAIGAVGGTAITGSLKQGLMAGLGAFGGASLAGAAGIGAAASTAVPAAGAGGVGAAGAGGVGSGAAGAAGVGSGAAGTAGVGSGAAGAAGGLGDPLASIANPFAAPASSSLFDNVLPPIGFPAGAGAVPAAGAAGGATAPAATGVSGALSKFSEAAAKGLPVGGTLASVAPYVAGAGVLSPFLSMGSSSTTPEEKPNEYGYTGPYTANRTTYHPGAPGLAAPGPAPQFNPGNFDSSEKTYFSPTTYTDASGSPWIPGQKTTPTAANASSFMAKPVGVTPSSMAGMNLTPEQMASLQQYGTINPPTGYADGGQVDTQPYTFPIQAVPQPSPQVMDGSSPTMQQPQQPQPTPYMQPTSYGQPQDNNPNNKGSIQGLPGLRGGGTVPLKNGSFVVDARTVSELGNGSSGAGQDLLARLGGRAIHGPGDGVSDSVRANIGGTQQARVARDEVEFNPAAVQKLGGGSHQRGTQKLYTLMAKASKARKVATRGQDTGLRRGIG